MAEAVSRRRAARTGSADDGALVLRLAGGDLEALGELFDRHASGVRTLVGRLGLTDADRDDVVQSVFLELLHLSGRHDGRPVRPWLLGIAAMAVRRHRRSLRRLFVNFAGTVFERHRPAPRTPEDEVSREQTHAEFHAAVDKLSTKKREVFVLVMEGMRGEEVAVALGIPVATVWTRLHHARKELREALGELSP